MHPFSAFAEEIAAESRLLDILRLQFKVLKLRLWLRKYSPAQPRVPAGNPDGGQWTSGSGGGSPDVVLVGLDDGIDGLVGGDGTDPLGGGSGSGDPDLLTQRPRSGSVLETLKLVARLVPSPLDLVSTLAKYAWMQRYSAELQSYSDLPKTIDELIAGVDNPRAGYQIHHIVEQTAARRNPFPESFIESRANKVLIPTMRHWDITRWYTKENETFGNKSPRYYLEGRSWAVRYQVGLEALKLHGVLK
jgi:hypothetical protein